VCFAAGFPLSKQEMAGKTHRDMRYVLPTPELLNVNVIPKDLYRLNGQ
jgi:hypothetical protein